MKLRILAFIQIDLLMNGRAYLYDYCGMDTGAIKKADYELLCKSK